ncbi:MAG TPA: 3-hydroxyacyl-CoA dehydrogenase NAD-binding domain-containing protein [Archangium sp.]|uniref:3-hydroxyacyl-CoA dehydrogenase NAD-binding domain-containing protein n=1 Tax=Archangium sp. TaxID=1872627 RepID=UPI002E34EF73|nr:3-hydroxyacyl-CoA dehydrogenase NAD-binding domain-containing protein [Archangium sp.]HEX5746997.1 3-hydroxyacyl-CoA dehydrogenase NAD-binding domain-containing protein [Archangium sp.]
MESRRIKRIGMVGGGAMGCGIALEFATAGRQVTLYNTRSESSAQAQVRIERDAALMVETGPSPATAAALWPFDSPSRCAEIPRTEREGPLLRARAAGEPRGLGMLE